MPKDAPPNGAAPQGVSVGPRSRVSEMQAKPHRWAVADPGRRFDDLFNFVHDPVTLIVAFDRVAGNRGAWTRGVDGLTVADVEDKVGVPGFLDDLRTALRDGSFRPLPVRERKIPKPGRPGKVRTLGVPVVVDRVLQARVKNALEPEWEARFEPKSYGFRPGRGCHDAIEAIYQAVKGRAPKRLWALDANLAAAFDRVDHDRLLEHLGSFPARRLIRDWLKAGVMDKGRFTADPLQVLIVAFLSL